MLIFSFGLYAFLSFILFYKQMEQAGHFLNNYPETLVFTTSAAAFGTTAAIGCHYHQINHLTHRIIDIAAGTGLGVVVFLAAGMLFVCMTGKVSMSLGGH